VRFVFGQQRKEEAVKPGKREVFGEWFVLGLVEAEMIPAWLSYTPPS
jgi:hypothetical protein